MTRAEYNKILEEFTENFYKEIIKKDEEDIERIKKVYVDYNKKIEEQYKTFYNPKLSDNILTNYQDEKLDNNLKEIEKEFNKEIYLIMAGMLTYSIINSYKFNKATYKMFLNKNINIVNPNKKFINKILNYKNYGLTIKERTILLSNNLAENVNQIIKNGLQNSININVVKQNIQDTLNSSFRKANTIAITESARAFNQTKLAEISQEGIFKYIIIVAVLDKKTTEICKNKNNKIIKVEETGMSDIPPYHQNCRSTFQPYIDKKEFDKIKKNEDLTIDYKEFLNLIR